MEMKKMIIIFVLCLIVIICIGLCMVNHDKSFEVELSKTYYQSDYSESDNERIKDIYFGKVKPADEDYEKYDFFSEKRFHSGQAVIVHNILNHGDLNIVWSITVDLKTQSIKVVRSQKFSDGLFNDYTLLDIG